MMDRAVRISRSTFARKRRRKVKALREHRLSLLFSRLRKARKKGGSAPSEK
tara:strand:- start:189 stop:341 length:153 start_codon:yes stop_codon:yes gene_type:complete